MLEKLKLYLDIFFHQLKSKLFIIFVCIYETKIKLVIKVYGHNC